MTLKNAFVNAVPEKEMEIVEAYLGSPLRLRCDLPDAYPKVDVTWSKQKINGSIKVLRDPRFTTDPEGSLWFTNVIRSDEFQNDTFYACFMTLKYLNRYIPGNKIQLVVLPSVLKRKEYRPIRQYVSSDQTTVVGGKVEFFCIYGGNPMPQTNWTKDGEAIDFNNRTRLENHKRSLVITNVTEADNGTYSCEVWNGVGDRHLNTFELDVEVPPYFVREIESTSVAEGNDVTFECDVSGVPIPAIEWRFNLKPIAQAPRNPHRTVTSGIIIIRQVSKDDMGNYGCNASNSRGYAYKDFFLDVIKVPTETEPPEEAETTETVNVEGGVTQEVQEKEKQE